MDGSYGDSSSNSDLSHLTSLSLFSHIAFSTPHEREHSLFNTAFISFLHTFSTDVTQFSDSFLQSEATFDSSQKERMTAPAMKSLAAQSGDSGCNALIKGHLLHLIKSHWFCPVFFAVYYSLKWGERVTHLPVKLWPLHSVSVTFIQDKQFSIQDNLHFSPTLGTTEWWQYHWPDPTSALLWTSGLSVSLLHIHITLRQPFFPTDLWTTASSR